MQTHAKRLICLFSACLLTGMCLTACGPNTTNEPATEPSESVAESLALEEGQKTSYSVTVQDYLGNALHDVVVNVFQENEEVDMKVAKDGKATFSLPAGNYTFTLSPTKGTLHYDQAVCNLSPATPDVTITLYAVADKTLPLVSPAATPEVDAEGNGTYPTQDAPILGEGATYCELIGANEMTYFVFQPSRGGVYKVSFIADGGADIGYYGMPINIFETKLLDTVDNTVEISVRDDSVNAETPNQTIQLVFGILPESGTTDCIVTIERIGDIQLSPADMPWQEYNATQVKAFEGTHGNTLVDIDVTDLDLKVIFNESDGFYHLGTADGPVVFIRINSASPYLDSLVTITEHTRLGVYIYDDDKNFVRKESYHNMLDAYNAICDDNGVCPLTPELEYMIKQFGNSNDWWNFSEGRHIFRDKIVPPETAWLFICCYYK